MPLLRPFLVLSTLVLVAWSGALADSDSAPPGSTEIPSQELLEAKPRPPVSLTLEAEDSGVSVVARLTVQARHPVAGAVARLVPPEGTTLEGGPAEIPLEALGRGEIRQVSWTLDRVASGPLRLAAGLDVRVAPGVLLHRSVVTELAAPRQESSPARILDGPQGGVRVFAAR